MTVTKTFTAALLAGTFLCSAAPALAAQDVPESDAAADAAIAAVAAPTGDQAKIDLLEAQVEALQESIELIKASLVKSTPAFKGAPLLEDKDAGWSFKPRGRIQYDAGFVSTPDNVINRNLGFNTRARRIRLGAEGTIPGGFGYKFEMDFANSSVGFGDVILTYAPSDKPWNVAIGNMETNNGLEQMTSSRFTSFLERAAFDDAFINTRRIGLNLGFVNKAGTFRANAGLFAAHSIDSSLDNEGWIAATRAVYAPMMGSTQLHLGANFQHREFQANNNGVASTSSGAPSTNQLARYRARPFSQLTDVRFVDTGSFAAKSDNIIGLELAAIAKSLHFASEAQWLNSNAYGAGDTLNFADSATLNLFPGTPGSVSALTPDGNPGFWGGYAEVGYYFTGETRGYKNGTFDRTKVLRPFSKGGWGALQLNGRIDYLDLSSKKLQQGATNDFLTGVSTASTNYGRGGKQLGLMTSLIWIPEDYMRFLFQYSHADITGGPLASVVHPTSTKPLNKLSFGVDSFAVRAQVDF